MQKFCDILETSQLLGLRLESNGMGDQEVDILSRYLPRITIEKFAFIGQHAVQPGGFSTLFQSFCNTQITELNFSFHFSCTKEVAKTLFDLLPSTNITKLIFNHAIVNLVNAKSLYQVKKR